MGNGIRDKVAIIGMGCSKFGERWEDGPEDLMVEAFQEWIQDAGIDKKDIQAAWLEGDVEGLIALTAGGTGPLDQAIDLALHPGPVDEDPGIGHQAGGGGSDVTVYLKDLLNLSLIHISEPTRPY